MKLGIHKTFKGKRLYTEVWKDIVGYEGLYQVSNMGRVRSLERIVKHSIKGKLSRRKGEMMKLYLAKKSGYKQVRLSKEGKAKTLNIHRLVAEAFLPNPENKREVDHINTVATDNRVCNLRWTTRTENNNNELTCKHRSLAMKGRILSEEQVMRMRKNSPFKTKVMCIETGIIYESAMEAYRQTGIRQCNINHCCNGKRKHAGGYSWKYV